MRESAQYPVPSYLPKEGRAVVPWARKRVALLAKRAGLDHGDVWDEAITALLRACVYFKPGAGTFEHYAKVSIERGLWRYALPNKKLRHNPQRNTIPFRDGLLHEYAPSCEEIAIARESARARMLPGDNGPVVSRPKARG